MTGAAPSPMRALLVDDEPPALLGLRALLAPHGDVEIVGEATGGRRAIEMVRALAPDVVFLDVQMPEVDGFAVLDAIVGDGAPARPPLVIFVTAYDAHALRAFDVGAADYLLKPVGEDRFARALARARERLRSTDVGALTAQLDRVLAAYTQATSTAPHADGGASPTRHLERIAVRVGARDVLVSVAEVEWIEADDYCVVLHQNGRQHVVRTTLQSLEQQLDPRAFLRVHRSAIVQLSSVVAIHRHGLGRMTIELRDGRRLPVSRGRQGAVVRSVGRAK